MLLFSLRACTEPTSFAVAGRAGWRKHTCCRPFLYFVVCTRTHKDIMIMRVSPVVLWLACYCEVFGCLLMVYLVWRIKGDGMGLSCFQGV